MEEQKQEKQEKQVYVNLRDLQERIKGYCPKTLAFVDETEFERGMRVGFNLAAALIQEPIDYVMMNPDTACVYRS